MTRTGQHPWLHPGWKILAVTAQTPTVPAAKAVRLITYNLLSIAFGRLSLVIDYVKWPGGLIEQLNKHVFIHWHLTPTAI